MNSWILLLMQLHQNTLLRLKLIFSVRMRNTDVVYSKELMSHCQTKKGNLSETSLAVMQKQLTFEFVFEDIDDRDEIEKILQESLASIHGVKTNLR